MKHWFYFTKKSSRVWEVEWWTMFGLQATDTFRTRTEASQFLLWVKTSTGTPARRLHRTKI